MGVYQFVGFLDVDAIGQCPMFERPHVVESVIAHLMSFFYDAVVQVVIA